MVEYKFVMIKTPGGTLEKQTRRRQEILDEMVVEGWKLHTYTGAHFVFER